MSDLNCSLCGRSAGDLDADVVVDRDDLSAPDACVNRLQVVCRGCMARPEVGGRFHTMWGLDWLRSHYLAVTRGLMTDLASGSPDVAWSGEAVDGFVRLGYFLLPGQETDGGANEG